MLPPHWSHLSALLAPRVLCTGRFTIVCSRACVAEREPTAGVPAIEASSEVGGHARAFSSVMNAARLA